MIEYTTSKGLCVLRLNSPPVNTISFELLEELTDAIRRACDDGDVRGIVITGGAKHFSAGADVNIFKEISSAAEAVETSRVFQETFGIVEAGSKPVVAAVAGNVMGSALELAMACTWRICDPRTKFSMPEIRLGINPGAGGTQRLPRLIGAEKAIRMLLTAESIKAEAALEVGLVDAICDPESVIDCAVKLIDSVDVRKGTSLRTDKVSDASENEAAFACGEELLKRQRPEVIAGSKILEAVRTGLCESFEAGLVKEQQVFAECMETTATRNKIYLFFATRETGKIGDLADVDCSEIKTAAVVGMGSMGTGIAHALIIAGYGVTVFDENTAAAEKGVGRIKKSVEKRVSAGKMAASRAEGMLSLISAGSDWSDIAGADIVIEAVFEKADVKRAVFAEIEKVCRADAIIATNTSTLSLDDLADGMANAERLVGLHFFNPAHVMPLVEVIRREATSHKTIATAMKFAKKLRKTPVLVRNREGFVVNRIFIPYLKEAFYLLEDGADARTIDGAAVEFGMAMGPLTLIDMAGLDILAFTDEVMRRVFSRHRPASGVLEALVENGLLGQKTGGGVYKYTKGDYTPGDNSQAQKIIADVREKAAKGPCRIDKKTIAKRLILRMVNEAFYVMEEGIAERESDVDVAMVLGTGFPDFRGGVLKYAHDIGIDNVIERLESLTASLGERFAPSEFLKNLKGT